MAARDMSTALAMHVELLTNATGEMTAWAVSHPATAYVSLCLNPARSEAAYTPGAMSINDRKESTVDEERESCINIRDTTDAMLD